MLKVTMAAVAKANTVYPLLAQRVGAPWKALPCVAPALARPATRGLSSKAVPDWRNENLGLSRKDDEDSFFMPLR